MSECTDAGGLAMADFILVRGIYGDLSWLHSLQVCTPLLAIRASALVGSSTGPGGAGTGAQ